MLHTRWNRDLAPAAVVRPGEAIQLLCRDALDIGAAARTLTPDASMTVDLPNWVVSMTLPRGIFS